MLRLFTVYDHPSDYPDAFVVREHDVARGGSTPGRLIIRAATLDDARDLLHRHAPGLVCLGREPGDDPVIVETWV